MLAPHDRRQVIGLGRRVSAAAPRSSAPSDGGSTPASRSQKRTCVDPLARPSARRPGTDSASPSRSRPHRAAAARSSSCLRLRRDAAPCATSDAAAPGQRCLDQRPDRACADRRDRSARPRFIGSSAASMRTARAPNARKLAAASRRAAAADASRARSAGTPAWPTSP